MLCKFDVGLVRSQCPLFAPAIRCILSLGFGEMKALALRGVSPLPVGLRAVSFLPFTLNDLFDHFVGGVT